MLHMVRDKKHGICAFYDGKVVKITIHNNIVEKTKLKDKNHVNYQYYMKKRICELINKIEKEKSKTRIFNYSILNSLYSKYINSKTNVEKNEIKNEVKDFLFILKKMKSDKKKIFNVKETENKIYNIFDVSITNRYVPDLFSNDKHY